VKPHDHTNIGTLKSNQCRSQISRLTVCLGYLVELRSWIIIVSIIAEHDSVNPLSIWITIHKCTDEFNPDSAGYTYVRGKHLVETIIDLHRLIGKDISRSEAAYRSHLIIEMIYDLVIRKQIEENMSIGLLENAINFTLEKKAQQFCADMAWLYGIESSKSLDVLKKAAVYMTRERMERFMNLEGRISLFTNKFDLRNDNAEFATLIKALFRDALTCVENDDFVYQSVAAIDKCGWVPVN
ncbi:MAG TPA: hypothetical protein PKY71_02540, partial [Smithellaceae bacterium]|nr:hypothetical protein [Smithellaceae bacterium]